MSKHTPGPWKPYQVQNAINGEPLDKWGVAEANPQYPMLPHSVTSKNDGTLTEPDARLIAAAPDLLATLKAAEPHLYMATDGIRQAVRAAIAKAEGVS